MRSLKAMRGIGRCAMNEMNSAECGMRYQRCVLRAYEYVSVRRDVPLTLPFPPVDTSGVMVLVCLILTYCDSSERGDAFGIERSAPLIAHVKSIYAFTDVMRALGGREE